MTSSYSLLVISDSTAGQLHNRDDTISVALFDNPVVVAEATTRLLHGAQDEEPLAFVMHCFASWKWHAVKLPLRTIRRRQRWFRKECAAAAGFPLMVELRFSRATGSEATTTTTSSSRSSEILTRNDSLYFMFPPPPAYLHFHLCFTSSMHALFEMKRQYRIRCRMAVLSTVGGGWASVRNAQQALRCAVEMYDLATQVGDELTMRKCRVFVGWALVWHHQHEALRGYVEPRQSDALTEAHHIFTAQLREASVSGDDANWNRCFAALHLWDHMLETTSKVSSSSSVSGATMLAATRQESAASSNATTSSSVAGQDNEMLDEWKHLFVTK